MRDSIPGFYFFRQSHEAVFLFFLSIKKVNYILQNNSAFITFAPCRTIELNTN